MLHGEQCLEEPWERLQCILPQMHLVSSFVFRYNFKPPTSNICIIFLRPFFWMLWHREFNLVYPESRYGLLPCFYAFPDILYNTWQATCLNWSVLRKLCWRTALLIVSVYSLIFTYFFLIMIFWTQIRFLGSLLCWLHSCTKV